MLSGPAEPQPHPRQNLKACLTSRKAIAAHRVAKQTESLGQPVLVVDERAGRFQVGLDAELELAGADREQVDIIERLTYRLPRT